MPALSWPVRQVLEELAGSLGVLRAERETVCALCHQPCPSPPDPSCGRVRGVLFRIARLERAYDALAREQGIA